MENAMSDFDDILGFWFGTLDKDGMADHWHRQRWFSGGDDLDAEISQLFTADLAHAKAGDYDDWPQTPAGRLALIVLLDQFSRNIFRGQAEAFAADPLAQALVEEGLSCGHQHSLPLAYQLFFYMPLMHAEDKALQALSVTAFAGLHRQAPENLKPVLAQSLRFAQEHQAIIQRFGRFPYRNRLLGRPNSTEENTWLAKNPGGFGQG